MYLKVVQPKPRVQFVSSDTNKLANHHIGEKEWWWGPFETVSVVDLKAYRSIEKSCNSSNEEPEYRWKPEADIVLSYSEINDFPEARNSDGSPKKVVGYTFNIFNCRKADGDEFVVAVENVIPAYLLNSEGQTLKAYRPRLPTYRD